MKMKTYGVFASLLGLLLSVMPAIRAQAFDDLERACQTQAAVAMHVSRSDVEIRRGEELNDGSGNYILLWDARLQDGGHSRGYCQVDPRQRQIVRFESREYPDHGHVAMAPVSDYPRVRVDTGGDGTFDGGRFRNIHLQSVYLDTRERPTLVLRGVHEFRIAFYGEVIASDSPREFVLRINSSDHGDVHGRAEIRLNRDANEVDSLDFHGSMDGSELNSRFVREH